MEHRNSGYRARISELHLQSAGFMATFDIPSRFEAVMIQEGAACTALLIASRRNVSRKSGLVWSLPP